MKKYALWMVAVLGASALPAAAMAADSRSDVQVTLAVQRVVPGSDGKEVLAEAREIKPGDLLEYRAVYRNQGKQAARDVMAVLPVPANSLSYVPASAGPQRVWASLDGRTFEVAPLMRVVTLPNGKRESRPVPASEYRYLRWDLGDIKPGDQATVAARMRMADVERQAAGGAK